MRRVLVAVTVATVLAVGGCGSISYEKRLEKTLENMRYQKRLDDNLQKPPAKTEGKYEELFIYIRPPKKLVPSKEFTLTVLEPGKFDLEGTFLDGQQALHVLARIEKPKTAAKKKAAPTAADTAVRGDFATDVVGILNGVYRTEVDVAKGKVESYKSNPYKHYILDAGDKAVQVYIYGTKKDPYQVALIFEYPKATDQAIPITKIQLCLESFAVGAKAQKLYSGTSEEEAGSGAAAPGAF